MSCGVGDRCSSDPKFLWLWCRLAAVNLIGYLAWEFLYTADKALKPKKKKKKKKKKKGKKKKNKTTKTKTTTKKKERKRKTNQPTKKQQQNIPWGVSIVAQQVKDLTLSL